jgi:hypothetical protein
MLLTRLHRRNVEKWLWVPLLTVGADLAENTLLSVLALTYPDVSVWVARAAAGATFLKWSGLTGCLLGILGGLVRILQGNRSNLLTFHE